MFGSRIVHPQWRSRKSRRTHTTAGGWWEAALQGHSQMEAPCALRVLGAVNGQTSPSLFKQREGCAPSAHPLSRARVLVRVTLECACTPRSTPCTPVSTPAHPVLAARWGRRVPGHQWGGGLSVHLGDQDTMCRGGQEGTRGPGFAQGVHRAACAGGDGLGRAERPGLKPFAGASCHPVSAPASAALRGSPTRG